MIRQCLFWDPDSQDQCKALRQCTSLPSYFWRRPWRAWHKENATPRLVDSFIPTIDRVRIQGLARSEIKETKILHGQCYDGEVLSFSQLVF